MQIDNRLTLKAVSVWGICALFFLYEFLLRIVVGTFQLPIMDDFKLSPFKFSLISSTMYLLIYAVMQIPVGVIIDKYGLKKSLLIGAVTCTISVIGFSYTDNIIIAIILRMLTGFGSSFGFICLIFAVYDWLPNRNSAFFLGISQFIGTLGPMFAAGPLTSIALHANLGWREVFFVLGIFGIVLTLLILFFVENNKRKVGNYTLLILPTRLKVTLTNLFLRKEPWAIAIFSALVYFSLEYLSENEGKLFVILKGYEASFAAYMITLSWLGYAIGCPLLGFLSDYFQRRRPILLLTSISCTVAIIAVVFSKNQFNLIIAFFLLGFSASGQNIGFAIMAEQFKRSFLAIGLAINNAMITLFTSINAPLMSLLIDYSKAEKMVTLPDYQFAFSFLIGAISLSIIIALFMIKETFCKSAVELTVLSDSTTAC